MYVSIRRREEVRSSIGSAARRKLWVWYEPIGVLRDWILDARYYPIYHMAWSIAVVAHHRAFTFRYVPRMVSSEGSDTLE